MEIISIFNGVSLLFMLLSTLLITRSAIMYLRSKTILSNANNNIKEIERLNLNAKKHLEDIKFLFNVHKELREEEEEFDHPVCLRTSYICDEIKYVVI